MERNDAAVVETDALLARSLERRACHRLGYVAALGAEASRSLARTCEGSGSPGRRVWNAGRLDLQRWHSRIRIAWANWDIGGTGRAKDLAMAISQVLDDPALARAMGEAGRQRAVDHFSWDVVVRRLADLVETVPKQDCKR
jgi:hypothetical protein